MKTREEIMKHIIELDLNLFRSNLNGMFVQSRLTAYGRGYLEALKFVLDKDDKDTLVSDLQKFLDIY